MVNLLCTRWSHTWAWWHLASRGSYKKTMRWSKTWRSYVTMSPRVKTVGTSRTTLQRSPVNWWRAWEWVQLARKGNASQCSMHQKCLAMMCTVLKRIGITSRLSCRVYSRVCRHFYFMYIVMLMVDTTCGRLCYYLGHILINLVFSSLSSHCQAIYYRTTKCHAIYCTIRTQYQLSDYDWQDPT